MLEIENLVSSYGLIKALKGVSLHVDKGELVSLVGANGAGKSTLLKSIIGLVKVEKGKITYLGSDITHEKYFNIIKKGIAIVPEGRKIFADATVLENLELGAFARRKDPALDKKILAEVFECFPRLYERRKQMGGTLSGGEQQMLAIGRALMADPTLLILDEPSMGLAPVIVEQVFSIIEKIKQTGTTMLLVEQNAMMALRVSDRAYILNTGKIASEDRAENILRDNSLLKAYLGKED